jgi:DNA polymerase
MPNYVPGYGSSSAKLVAVGEAPGKHEDETLIPFSGPAGRLLDEALACTPLTRNDIYTTNVVKVRPPNNDLKKLNLIGHTIEEFLPQLWTELESINPNCILALGGTALETLTKLKGIEKYRGSILKCYKTGQKVVPTLHPAALLHTEGGKLHPYKEFAWIKNDVVRAYQESLSSTHRPPQRNLQVSQSSAQFIRFLEQYSGHNRVYIDVETIMTFAQCIGLAFNSYDALSVPLFNDGNEEGQIPPHDLALIWKIWAEFFHDTKIQFCAQNAKFDEKRCRQLGLNWHDCYYDMAMGWHMLYPEFPKKLEFISSVLTEEPYYKDEGREFNSKDKRANFRQWLMYNAKDAAVEYECGEIILDELKKQGLYEFFFDRIMPLHRLYSDIEDVGILVDEECRKHLGKKYSEMRAEKQTQLIQNITQGDPQLYEVYKGFNVMSNGAKNQVAKLLFGFLRLPVRKDTGDDTLKSLANNNAKNPRIKNILLGILEVRKVRKTIGTYIEAELSPADCTRFGKPAAILSPGKPRLHTQCNINGTETGRTSTGILKPPVAIGHEGISLQGMTKHEDVTLSVGGGDLRSQYVADENFVFMEPDLSQAEDRVTCVLARDWDALKQYERTEFKYNKNGLKDDRHTNTAIYVCSVDFEGITDYERQVGKRTRHSGNYAVGKHQHMLTLAKSGIFISEYTAGKQLDRFHAENPKIKAVFHEEIIEALRSYDCKLTTPFGRTRTFYNRWGEEMFKEAFAYIPQSTVSDQVKFAMLEIKEALGAHYLKNFFFLEESHDSFLALCHMSIVDMAARAIKKAMEKPIDFRRCTLSRDYDLVIPSDLKCGRRWVEVSEEFPDGMKKYKV